MKYENIKKAKFISRPNRFIALVQLEGQEITVHVKNTGRCRELLLPGVTVYLEKAKNPERKTPYDLVAVDTPIGIINIDSKIIDSKNEINTQKRNSNEKELNNNEENFLGMIKMYNKSKKKDMNVLEKYE